MQHRFLCLTKPIYLYCFIRLRCLYECDWDIQTVYSPLWFFIMSKEKPIDPHDDSMLMIPPPGFKFIPRFEAVCGKPGCFECFDIYCERCESKDRRIVELEMRNNDLVKYITQLQGRMFGQRSGGGGVDVPQFRAADPGIHMGQMTPSGSSPTGSGSTAVGGTSNPFAYIQSPVLYDPNMNVSYVATTTFAPAPHDPAGASPPAPPTFRPSWLKQTLLSTFS